MGDRNSEAGDDDSAPSIDPRLDKLVGDKLRNYFDSLMDESVPDRIVELLAALAKKDSAADEGESA